jgi:hypothetical protein
MPEHAGASMSQDSSESQMLDATEKHQTERRGLTRPAIGKYITIHSPLSISWVYQELPPGAAAWWARARQFPPL